MKVAAIIGLVLFAVAGQATPVYFTGNGSPGGVDANAEASITINSNNLVIELWNTGGPGDVQDLASELTGISFSLVGGSAVLTDSSLSGSAPEGGENCGSGTCVAATPPAEPFGWAISGTSTVCLGAGGCGTWKNEAIVNSNVAVADGVANSEHNPLLLSSTDDSGSGVTFTVDFTGTAPTSINTSSVVFDFGTGPATVDGVLCTGCGGGGNTESLPEPVSIGLTAGGLIALGLFRRKISFGWR